MTSTELLSPAAFMHTSPWGTRTPPNPPSTTLGPEARQRDTGVRIRANGDETDREPVTGGESLAASRGTLVAGKPPVSGNGRPVVDSEDVDLRRGGRERDKSILPNQWFDRLLILNA
jgi:hypothetical protein